MRTCDSHTGTLCILVSTTLNLPASTCIYLRLIYTTDRDRDLSLPPLYKPKPISRNPAKPRSRKRGHSKRINKIGPLIAEPLDLILRLALSPAIPQTRHPLLILPSQQEPLQQAPTEQEEGQVGEDGAVAGPEAGRVGAAVDVGGDDAVEVAPADDKAEGDAAFVDALDVVGGPGDGVADAGVDSEGAEVDARVLDAGFVCPCGGKGRSVRLAKGRGGGMMFVEVVKRGRRRGGKKPTKKHCKPGYTQKADHNVTQPTLPGPISDHSDSDGQNRRNRVRRHRKQLRSRGLITQTLDDGRHEQGKCIQGANTAHVDEHPGVGLPIVHRRPKIGHLELLVFGAGLLVLFQPPDHASPVINR